MKILLILLLFCNVCYGQKDSTKSKKDTSIKREFTITVYDRNGNVIRQYKKYNIDTVMTYPDTTFFIKPKID
jgi:hypothetical protein